MGETDLGGADDIGNGSLFVQAGNNDGNAVDLGVTQIGSLCDFRMGIVHLFLRPNRAQPKSAPALFGAEGDGAAGLFLDVRGQGGLPNGPEHGIGFR